jgi:hypothetical protein
MFMRSQLDKKRLVISEDDVCHRKFTRLNESVVFWQFDALFGEARTICEVDATNSG